MSAKYDARLEAMLESTSIGIGVVDAEGKWVRGNAALLDLLGCTHDELSKQPLVGARPGEKLETRFVKKSGEAVSVRLSSAVASQQFSICIAEDITVLRAEQQQRERLAGALSQRVRELTCLHRASRALADKSLSLDGLLSAVVELLPAALQFPAHATARLRLGARSHATKADRDSPVQLTSGFVTSSGEQGEVRVSYHAPPVQPTQAPFLAEEQALLDTLAEMLRGELNRRSAHEALARSTERLELALTTAEMGLWEWDVVSNRSYSSESIARMLGLEAHVEGELGVLANRMHPDDAARVYPLIQQFAADPASKLDELEYRLARREGGWRHMHARAFAERGDDGRARHILTVITDVSAQRAQQEHLRQAERMDAMGLVTGSVAHDFNNVLTAMLTGGELLVREVRDGPVHEAAQQICEAARRGAQLTRQLLAFTRKSDFQVAPVDLGALVMRNRPVLERLLGDAVRLQCELAEGCVANAQAGQLDQLLLVLATNAREAIGAGAGTVTLTVRPAQLETAQLFANLTARPGPLVELAMRDDGCGMTAEVAARVFEPFFTTRSARRATGLGLSVAFAILQQHDGFITVETAPGKGSTFRAYLPRLAS